MKIKLSELNRMDRVTFIGALADIFEHSPWVAELAHEAVPYASVDALHQSMLEIVRRSGKERMLALFRSHPDLATRLKISDLSAAEQQGVGLDRLTPDEFETFSALNSSYVEKFGFPFLFAVRGKTKDDILEAMKRRLPRSPEAEERQAFLEIERITGFRLHDCIEDDGEGESDVG